MLKGKTTIQLFDAETGEKLLEQRDENLVTHALDILANSKDKYGLLKWWRENASAPGNSYDYVTEHIITTPSFAMMPLAERALGGVLLWDENITEDPSITVPPGGVHELGHAGGEYAGADLYRGSYNTNESGEISGGWRHVWDFDTDKANGTVKCISLTSRHGGNVGYHGSFEEDRYPLFNHCYFHSDNLYTTTSAINHGIQFGGEDGMGSILYMKKESDGRLRLLKRFEKKMWYLTTPDLSGVSLTMTAPMTGVREDLPITLHSNYSTVYVYQGKIHEVVASSESTVLHRTFDLNTGAQLSSKEINLSFSSFNLLSHNTVIYREGNYYCFEEAKDEMITLNEQGVEQSRVSLPNIDYMYPPIIDDDTGNILLLLYYNRGNAVVPWLLRPDGSMNPLANENYQTVRHNTLTNGNNIASQFIKTDDRNSPFVFFCDAYYSANIVPLVNTAYLATINNLQTPINKTSAQTMKITYEIYDE